MFEYCLDYLTAGVIIGALLMIILFLILYMFGWMAVKSDFSDEWMTKANIVIVKRDKRKK